MVDRRDNAGEKRMKTLRWGIGLAAVLTVTTAHAAPETHDGFYFKLNFGSGSTVIETVEEPSSSIEGASGAFGLSLGYMVVQDLGLYVLLSGNSILGPTFRDADGSTSTADDKVEVGVGGLGIGAVYYFMPVNMYVAGSLISDSMTFRVDGENYDTETTGLGMELVVGKEWWVSDEWGLGIAASLRASALESSSELATEWSAASFNVLLSATYN